MHYLAREDLLRAGHPGDGVYCAGCIIYCTVCSVKCSTHCVHFSLVRIVQFTVSSVQPDFLKAIFLARTILMFESESERTKWEGKKIEMTHKR